MKSRYQKNTGGFTLIEMMVYLAIFLIVSVVAIGVLLSLDDMYANYRMNQSLRQGSTTLFERMLTDIREADGVILPDSSLVNPNGVLALHTVGTKSVEYSRNGGTVQFEDAGGTVVPITSENVTVDELTFFRYVNGETEMIRVRLTLTAVSGAFSKTMTFYAGSVLRGTYD